MRLGRFVAGPQTELRELCLRVFEVIEDRIAVVHRIEQVEPPGGDRDRQRDVGEHAPFGGHPLDLRPGEGHGVHRRRLAPRPDGAQPLVGRPGNGLPIAPSKPRGRTRSGRRHSGVDAAAGAAVNRSVRPLRPLRAGLGILLLVFPAGCGVTPEEADDLADAAADAALAERFPADDQPSADADADAGRDVPGDLAADALGDTAAADRPDRVDAAADRPAVGDGGCSSEMALVQGRVCVDRWEAHLEARDLDGGVAAWSPYLNPGTRWVRAVSTEGEVPQGYITGAESRDACRNAGKHLCALADWLAACRGPASQIYPYGNTYVHRRCNEGRTPHPVVQFYGTSVGVFTFARMNDPGINQQPDSLARTGAFTGCVSPDGLADMVGNLHEWIDDPAGTFKGGFYADAEINGRGCLYTTTAHNFDYRDYSTGFRCCADPR